jgi:hypothetical protein
LPYFDRMIDVTIIELRADMSINGAVTSVLNLGGHTGRPGRDCYQCSEDWNVEASVPIILPIKRGAVSNEGSTSSSTKPISGTCDTWAKGKGQRKLASPKRGFKDGDVLLDGTAAHPDAGDHLTFTRDRRSASHCTILAP